MDERLQLFIDTKQIPNILIYGSEYSNKEDILDEFIDTLYKDDINKQNKILNINCAEPNQGGIKFIREDLKFFSKKMIHNTINKTVILRNAGKLTHDAQSALRRCIEIYSKNTRFIILVEKKHSILNPILSRFCTIFIKDVEEKKSYPLKNCYFQTTIKKLLKTRDKQQQTEILEVVDNLYLKGVHIFHLMTFVEKFKDIEENYKYKLLSFIDLARQHIYNEKIIMYMLLYYFFMRCDIKIENLWYN